MTGSDWSAPRVVEPVRWIFHPSTRTEANARLKLDGQRELAVGEGGERWLEGEGAHADVAPFVAPEPLIDLGRTGDRYAFVGASGLVYLADEPLGPFVDVRRPPRPFVSATSQDGVLAGVEPSGGLWIGADWGARWEAAEVPNARFVEVALGARGTGLALAIPEAWWASADGGRSWRPTELPPLGARRIGRDAAGDLVVEGLFRRARYEQGRWMDPAPARSRPTRPSPTTQVEPAPDAAPSPDAARVQEGRAVLDDAGYFALELVTEEGERAWRVLSGPLGARLQERTAATLPVTECRDVRVARRGEHVAVLCGSKDAEHTSALVRLYVSEDAGATFQRQKLSLRGGWSELRLAIGPRGAVVLSGICPPHRTELGCAPRGVYRLSKGSKELEPLALPGLGRVDAVAVGPRDRLYVVGARDKDQRLSLYASLDDGRSFQIRDLEMGDGGAGDRRHGSERFVPRLTIDEDGAIAVVVRTSNGWGHVALDPEGHVLSRGAPPPPARSVAAVGLKALALDPARPSLWESLDGGSSWEVVPLPRPPCSSEGQRGSSSDEPCEVEMSCSPAGCLFGATLSRLGWDAEAESGRIGDPRAIPSGPATPPAPRTPIACVLGGEPWQTLEGVSGVPGAADAVVGRTTWFAVGADFETGAVWALHAYEGGRSVRRQQMFGPLAEPTRHALAVVDQVEGSAALRYRVPHSSRGEKEITAVEVAWDNRFQDLVGHAKIAGTFEPSPGDYRNHAPRTLLAQPALLSIAGRGVHVRLHASPQDRQPTYYTEGKTVETLPAVPWPASRESRRTEMVRVGARSLPIGFHGGGQWLSWARPSADAAGASGDARWSWGASLLGLPRPPAGFGQAVSITYSGLTPSLAVVQVGPGGGWWHAYTLPFQWGAVPFGEPAPAPLLADLPDPPPPCGASERRDSPRVVAPSVPGEAYTVLVTDTVDPPQVLTTARAVLHGTPDRPCLAAFEASGASARDPRASRSTSTTSGWDTTSDRFFAVLPAADLGHAWLFREVTASHWERTIHARPMSCRFDASAVIPPELSGRGVAP